MELDTPAYVYLLGLYLGDGSISRGARDVHRLTITQDAQYPALIDSCAKAVAGVMPHNRVGTIRRPGCVVVSSYSKHWPHLFPQTGSGPKWSRPIILQGWQQQVVDEQPKLLLRGLIHSDGCRSLNRIAGRVTTYEYPRYTFTQKSTDITRIFTDTCDALGVHWTRMNHKNTSIARRADVAFLDTFIGPKS